MEKKLWLIVIMVMILAGCNKKDILPVDDNVVDDSFIMITKLENGRTVYSEFSENYYIDDDGNKIDLKEALENNYISMDEIIKNMELMDSMNDGGSVIYKAKDNILNGTKDLYLASCNSLEGNGGIKDIFIGNDENIGDNCVKKKGRSLKSLKK